MSHPIFPAFSGSLWRISQKPANIPQTWQCDEPCVKSVDHLVNQDSSEPKTKWRIDTAALPSLGSVEVCVFALAIRFAAAC